MVENTLSFTQTLALVMSSLFLGYVVTIVVPYMRRKTGAAGDADDFEWHLFIPARDEEKVIADTIAHHREHFPMAHVWVIDDASDDGTASIVEALADGDECVHLVRRVRPAARTGKGDALNTAFDALDRWIRIEDADRARTVVGVVDADGRLEPGCFDVCAADRFFGDAAVGAVQIGVRMSNRADWRPIPDGGRLANFWARLLVICQEIEFQGPISAIQESRRKVGTVAMGGNGQFSRLTALDQLHDADGGPWRGALLEDFEIGVHILLDGWRTEHTEDTWVEQEGLVSFRRFTTQRTRWGQGTMQCIKYIPDLWRSDRLTNLGALEIVYYLVQPWMHVAASIIFVVPMVAFAVAIVTDPVGQWSFFLHDGGWTLVVLYLGFGVGVFAMWGPIYRHRRERRAGWYQSLGWGIAFFFYANTVYIADWRGLVRLVRGRNGWAKTRRNAEVSVTGPVALEH